MNQSDIWLTSLFTSTFQEKNLSFLFAEKRCNRRRATCADRGQSPTRKIVILTVGKYLWEDFRLGHGLFKRSGCPLTNCWFTDDYSKYRTTADALFMMEANSTILQKYMPKPSRQVRELSILIYRPTHECAASTMFASSRKYCQSSQTSACVSYGPNRWKQYQDVFTRYRLYLDRVKVPGGH